METAILLNARRYDFKDETTGRLVQGVTLQYLTADVENNDNDKGCMLFTITAPSEVWGQLQSVPGVYDMEFKQRPGKGGRPTLQCVATKFKAPYDIVKRAA